MDLHLEEELENEFWLPTKINELAQKGVKNVAHKTVPLLPELQRNRVLRAMEKAIHTELKTLTDDEFQKLETQMDELPFQSPKNHVIVFVFKYDDRYDSLGSFAYKYLVFTNKSMAAQTLHKHTDHSLEECLELVQSDEKYVFARLSNDEGSIEIIHVECNQIN